MNRLEGELVFMRGSGLVRLAGLNTSIGRLYALVLDVGSPERSMAIGRKLHVLFKETAVMVAIPHHQGLDAQIVSFSTGEVVVEMEVVFAGGTVVKVVLPPEELPVGLAVGDRICLRVPASAVALEME